MLVPGNLPETLNSLIIIKVDWPKPPNPKSSFNLPIKCHYGFVEGGRGAQGGMQSLIPPLLVVASVTGTFVAPPPLRANAAKGSGGTSALHLRWSLARRGWWIPVSFILPCASASRPRGLVHRKGPPSPTAVSRARGGGARPRVRAPRRAAPDSSWAPCCRRGSCGRTSSDGSCRHDCPSCCKVLGANMLQSFPFAYAMGHNCSRASTLACAFA